MTEERQVPEASFGSYYGRPILKVTRWKEPHLPAYEVFDRSIDVHISALRKKLGDDPKELGVGLGERNGRRGELAPGGRSLTHQFKQLGA